MTKVEVGQVVSVEMPYSEVMMYMRLAGTVQAIMVKEHCAQIVVDGREVGGPVCHGEAGILWRDGGLYINPLLDRTG